MSSWWYTAGKAVARSGALKPNLYASGRHPDMNQTLLFVCSRKIKISCWAFLDGHPVKILKLSYQDMTQKCKTAQTNQINFLQDLSQICTQKCNQKCNQLSNFPLHTKNYVWFISGWRPDAYRLGFTFTFQIFHIINHKLKFNSVMSQSIQCWCFKNHHFPVFLRSYTF